MNKGNIVYNIDIKYSTFGIVKSISIIETPPKLLVNWCNGNEVNFDKDLLVLADQEYIVYMLKQFGSLNRYFKIMAIKEMLDGYKR